ncbi:SH3 domain-containing protein [Lignipirellula cremea]|uniref:SH3b domain-containing protein n=1 Tax=Lignipirellula cremea TaxID=2528010 RepID=A0A518DU23_9BACT|nr:SH3 domain-containing protein [Lignipirellula cremea]QDU95340.1 hypothetical protein Pla8534_31550 [Lignipirellula cremea]
MRLLLTGIAGWLLALASIAGAAEPPTPEFPFTAYVEFEDVYVRSGPGDTHYPTQRLPLGTKVDVYKVEGDGWYAIRPPEGSFCWIPESQLRKQPDSTVAEVTADNAVAWIGSQIRAVDEHRFQVRLKRGEAVEILGSKEVATGGGRQEWCKIAPPAGDFRWIYRQFLTRTPVAVNQTPKAPPTIPAEQPPSQFVARTDAKPIERLETNDAAGPSSPADGFSQRPIGTGVRLASAEEEAAASAAAPTTTAAAPRVSVSPIDVAPTDNATDPFSQQLNACDLELSLLVAQPIESWRLNPLHEKVTGLVENGATVVERGRARLLLEKVDQFRNLYSRQLQIYQKAPGLITVAGATPLAAPGTIAPASATTPLAQGPAPQAMISPFAVYDSQGWLMPIVAQRDGTPTYALVDDTGRIVSYVTAAPGLNIHRYLKQQIGVYGQRNFLPELGSHVMVQRVIVLSR